MDIYSQKKDKKKMDESVFTSDDAIECVNAVMSLSELFINLEVGGDVIEFSTGRLNRIGRMLFDEAEKLEKYIKSI